MKKIFFTLSLFVILGSFQIADAQETKDYFYKSFDANITVEKDSSFIVEERQLYSYQGRFNKGYRNIPLKGVSDISDVVVIDGETGKTLEYSPKVLEKYNAASWGSYTFYKKNGEMIIEWYYNLENTDHLWIIKYKVYGGIGYYKDHDEIYWNIFTNYDVPIQSSIVNINLPLNNFVSKDLKATAYTTVVGNNPKNWNRESDQMFQYFSAGPFAPKEAFTVALGWPKGLLHQSDFWMYWLSINWPYVASGLIILITIISLFLYWLFSEKFKKGKGTIIAEYEPPHNLPPAMAEIIVMERNTPRAWAATVVDLAVRGYVQIKEDSSNELVNRFGKRNTIFFFLTFFMILGVGVINNNQILIVGTFIILFSVSAVIFGIGNSKDYEIFRLKGFEGDKTLHDYEKEFLKILFRIESFSTARMKRATPSVKNEMYKAMVDLKDNLSKEISSEEVSAFDIPFSNVTKYYSIYSIPVVLIFLSFFILPLVGESAKYILLAFVIIWSIMTSYYFIKFNPRLSQQGRILREEWLGFKLYLETAEKYRMQNLTTEIFEKYLPYAIIFGVEKKWAKAFESIVKAEPSWYGHARTLNTASGYSSSVSNFSASVFSSSFSSSFSSAFSSSGAGGGGGGGGGGAGGGGGGGGGGAS